MIQEFKPVFVWVSIGARQAVGDVVKAAEVLLKYWPKEFADSELHRAARLACLEAWQGDGDALVAREAFIKAAEEAEILAPENVRPTPGTDQHRRRRT